MIFNLDDKAFEILSKTLPKAILLLLSYVALYFLLNKIIKKKNIKAILIGLITPFFFYYFVGYAVYPLTLLLYVTGIEGTGIPGALIWFFFNRYLLFRG